jgi:hypothetical protein
VRTPFRGAGRAGLIGILRLRTPVRFAHRLASLRMTECGLADESVRRMWRGMVCRKDNRLHGTPGVDRDSRFLRSAVAFAPAPVGMTGGFIGVLSCPPLQNHVQNQGQRRRTGVSAPHGRAEARSPGNIFIAALEALRHPKTATLKVARLLDPAQGRHWGTRKEPAFSVITTFHQPICVIRRMLGALSFPLQTVK